MRTRGEAPQEEKEKEKEKGEFRNVKGGEQDGSARGDADAAAGAADGAVDARDARARCNGGIRGRREQGAGTDGRAREAGATKRKQD